MKMNCWKQTDSGSNSDSLFFLYDIFKNVSFEFLWSLLFCTLKNQPAHITMLLRCQDCDIFSGVKFPPFSMTQNENNWDQTVIRSQFFGIIYSKKLFSSDQFQTGSPQGRRALTSNFPFQWTNKSGFDLQKVNLRTLRTLKISFKSVFLKQIKQAGVCCFLLYAFDSIPIVPNLNVFRQKPYCFITGFKNKRFLHELHLHIFLHWQAWAN